MTRTEMILTAGVAALALGGTFVAATPALAGSETGVWRNGTVAVPYRGGYYGGGYRPAGYGYRPAGYGYRPAGYGYRPYYRHHSNVGGAVAAGVIGGLALGALASTPAYAYPAYSYPAYPATYPGYYGTTVYSAPACYTSRRSYVDAWGRTVVRSTRVCE